MTDGVWVEITRPWHDPSLTTCDLCGRLVPKRYWAVTIDKSELRFCNKECEDLYRSYWLPKYGDEMRDREKDMDAHP